MLLPSLVIQPDVGAGLLRAVQIGARLPDGADTLLGKPHLGDSATVDDQATQAIIERARAGDGEAFASLFREYQRDVRRVCQRMLGEAQAADDAVNEVFLRARRALEGFDTERPFRPWLIAIAGHYCIDQLRQRTTEARVFSGMEFEESELESPGPSPLGRVMAAEQRKAVGRAIESLPEHYRLPLLLRYFDDMDYEGIAKNIGVTRNQVGTLLFRAKRLLREAVESQANESVPRTRRRTRGTRGKRATGQTSATETSNRSEAATKMEGRKQ